MIEPTYCSGLADIAARYDAFIVDQWGVLHDGVRPYPGAIACLERLRAEGKRVVALSNVSLQTRASVRHLQAMGFDPGLFEGVITAGEATWQALRERADPFFAGLGTNCLFWTRHGDMAMLDGVALHIVESVDEADFILLAGSDDGARLEDYEPALQDALARNLPLVCANPDVVVVTPKGVAMAPGAIARHYAALGGRVSFTGKPHPLIYRACLALLEPLAPAAILVIGDSIEHDIAGGIGAGLETALVMGGIHAPVFDLERGRQANWPALERLIRACGAAPRWVLPAFRWSAGLTAS